MQDEKLVRYISTFSIISLIIFMFLVNGGSLFAQKSQSTSDKSDTSIKSSARVNPTTLAMEFSLPLGSYPGRGGNSIPIIMNYSSKVWNMDSYGSFSKTHPANSNLEGYEHGSGYSYYTYNARNIYAEFAKRSNAGWSSSLQPVSIIETREQFDEFGNTIPFIISSDLSQSFASYQSNNNSNTCSDGTSGTIEITGGLQMVSTLDCPSGLGYPAVQTCSESLGYEGFVCVPPEPGGGTQNGGGDGNGNGNGNGNNPPTPNPNPPLDRHGVNRFKVQMSDGSTHEFRKSDTEVDCSDSPSNCSHLIESGTYLSVDGSGMRLERNEDQGDDANGNPIIRDVLYLPNGGKYIFYPNPGVSVPVVNGTHTTFEKYVDKNGNITSYDAVNEKLIDTLGREILNPLAPPLSQRNEGVDTQQYTVKGLPNQDLDYTLEWKKLADVFEDPATKLHYPGFDKCTNEFENPVDTADRLFTKLTQYETEIKEQTGVTGLFKVVNKQRVCVPGGFHFNPVVLAEVLLPNGQKYQFKYNEYGEITKIIYPTGGYERFVYATVETKGTNADDVYTQANRGVIERRVNYQDGKGEIVTTYSPTGDTIITSPDGSQMVTSYNYSTYSTFGFENPIAGRPLETRNYDTNVTENKLRSRTFYKYIFEDGRTTIAPDGSTIQPNQYAKRDPRRDATISIVTEPGNPHALMTLSQTKFDSHSEDRFFAHMNPIETISTKYVVITASEFANLSNDFEHFYTAYFDSNNDGVLNSSVELSSATTTSYNYDLNYLEAGILGLPIETKVLNPDDVTQPPLAKAKIFYDYENTGSNKNYSADQNYQEITNDSLNCSIDPQVVIECWKKRFGLNQIEITKKGRVTSQQLWDEDNQTWIESHTNYDIFGNAVETKDHLERESSAEFDSSYKYAYPTKTISFAPDLTDTHGTNQTTQAETAYDFITGLVLSVTDDYGRITKREYDDDLLRPTRVYSENYTAPETQTIYDDTNRTVTVKQQADETNWNESIKYFDVFGRTTKTKSKDLEGDVVSLVEYDNFGRVLRTSNPFRVDTNDDPTETVYWSKPRYDDAGRVVESFAPAIDGTTGSSLGVTSFAISNVQDHIGNVITTADASGRKRRAIINALGQVSRVDEPTNHGGTADADLGTISSPHQAATYEYDIRGNLIEMNQGSQTRTFVYDNFSRIKTATNPESGTVNYTYDIQGNLKTKRDARGIKTIYDYDDWGRIIKRCYRVIGTGGALGATDCASASGETNEPNSPDVSFYYDGKGLSQTANFAKGNLTKVSSSVSETLYTDFDDLGRIKTHEQITDGHSYKTSYKYNFAGALIEQKYPSGKVVRNFHDANGELASVVSHGKIHASNFEKTSAGAVEKMKLGNGLLETAQFNERFQPIQLGLGNDTNGTNLWKVNYEYGELNPTNGVVDQSKNIGNIAKQIITVPNANGETGFTATQTYSYDSLNRLKTATEKIGGNVNWNQSFNYDIYGNRNFDEANTTTLPKYCVENALPAVCESDRKALNPTINLSDNKFADQQGYEYDENGNVTKDSDGRQFVYDALNKQVKVKDINNQTLGNYFYDGESKRVKKTGNNENTVFVYDAFGALVEEFTVDDPQPQLPAETQTTYLTTDTLGSPRVITDENGEVVSRRDFLPFGEEILANENNRKSALGYNTGDNLRQKFTGYEKDTETDLEFAQNRYYSNKLGRFTTPDPLMTSARALNPQTLNRFTYVLNNPLNLIDPNGLMDCNPKKEKCPKKAEIENDGDPAGAAREQGTPVSGNVTVTATITGYNPNKNKGGGCGWNIFCHSKNLIDGIFGGGQGVEGGVPPVTIPRPDPPTLPTEPPDSGLPAPTPGDGNKPDPGGGDDDSAGSDRSELMLALIIAITQKYIDELLNGKPVEQRYVYRKGGQNPGNLAPRFKDINGLSATLDEPLPGTEYIKLDVEKLRAAGLLVINDRRRHVAIAPKTGKELVLWMSARKLGAGLNHKFTRAMKEAIVKYNRVK